VRLAKNEAHAYAQELHDMANLDSRCEIDEGYLSDSLFDTWIVAADYILVPYHEIWTSAVAARAKLYQRPLIAANTGGLAEQLTENSYTFSNDEELIAILRQISEQHSRPRKAAWGAGEMLEPMPLPAPPARPKALP
jgi:hypothetical protein